MGFESDRWETLNLCRLPYFITSQMQDISCSSSTISQQGGNLTSFSHLMSPTADLGKTQILQQSFHVEGVGSRRDQPKSGGGVKVQPPPLAVRKQNSELQSTRQTASAGFFKAFQSKAANQQMLVSQINRNIFGENGSSRGSNTIEPPDLLLTSKDTRVVEKKRDNQKAKPQETSNNAQRRQQRSLIASRRNSKEQVTYPLPSSRDEQAINVSTTSSSKRGLESSIISPPSTASEQQQKPSNYLKPLTREVSSRGRIFSQQSNSQATESFVYPGSKSSSRRVIGVHGLLPSIEGEPQVQSQQVSSRVLGYQQQAIDEDFRSYQSVKISKNLSKPPTSRQAQGKHSIIISAPISPPNEILDNSFFDSSQMSVPHSQINQTLEESMIMGGGQKPFKPQYPPTYMPVNRKRPVQQYPMSVGPKEHKQLSERGNHGESLHQWKHQTMAAPPSTVISQTKANEPLMFNDGNDLSTNYLTIDDTIPNTTGLYAQVGVGFENQGRAVSIDRSKRVTKESSMADFSSLSLVTKPSHHNVRQKVSSNLSTAQSMTANHHRPSFVFSPERPSQNIEALSNYQSLASLAYMQKGQLKSSEGDQDKQAPRGMLETGSFPSTLQQQTFGQQNLMVPQINFQNLVLSPQMQKELFFSPSMMQQISHQRQLSFNEDILKDLPSYQGASQHSPSQLPVLQPMIYLPPPVTALPIYGIGVTDQDSLLQSHKRSNSQGSYDQQLKKRPLKQRGLAQKIVLPKNSSFLTKSGLTNALGSFDPSNQQSANAAAAVLANLNQRKLNSGITGGLPLKDMTESHINVIQAPQVINNQQPQCIINFNISFGCFPKQEQYKQYRNEKTLQGCFSPERSEKPTASEGTVPDWLKPSPACELPNTSELLIGKKQASTGSSENAKPSSLTNLSTTDYITKRYSGPDLTTSSGNYSSPFSPEQSTAGKYQSKLIQEVKYTPQHEIEEMRKNIKTPCFNSGAANQYSGNLHHSAATDIKQPSGFL